MKTFTRFLCFFGLLLAGAVVQAQQLTQQVTYSVNDVDIQQVDGYDVISLTNAVHIDDEDSPGDPQLPVATINLLLPQGNTVSGVTISTGQETQLSGSFNLFPEQPPAYPNFSDPPPFVPQKTAVYNSNDPFPQEPLLSYEVHGFRDYTYISISYIPFRYLPASGDLYLTTQLTITVNYTTVSPSGPYKQRAYNHQDEAAYRHIQKTVANPVELDNFYPDVVTQLDTWRNTTIIPGYAYQTTDLPSPYGSRVEYVIITNDTDVSGNPVGDFVNKFQVFADWKTRSGTPAKVVTVDAIRAAYPGLDVPEQIRGFIQEAHELWGTEYVLLGGTAKIVPVRWIPGHPTDTYYSAIHHPQTGYADNWNANGDHIFGLGSADGANFVADIAVGRAPVNTDDKVDRFLHKNFTYTRNSLATNIPDGVWLSRQLGSYGACFDRRPPEYSYYTAWGGTGLHVGYEIIQAHHNKIDIYGMFEYIADRNDPNPTGFDSWCRAYYPLHNSSCTINQVPIDYEDANHAGFFNQLNQGYGLINVLDHGGPYRIGLGKVTQLPGLSMQDFQNLPDTGKYGILLAGGCHTAPIEREIYIGEHWVNSPGGGVAFYGASMDINAGSSYNFNKRFYNQLHNEGVYKLGWLHPSAANTDNLRKIMQLLGDPDLSIYTESPTNLNVTHASTITNGNQDFQVNVSGFPTGNTAKVSLYKEGEVLAYTETDDFPVTFNITPSTTGDLYVTATSRNKEPYEGTVSVAQYAGTHLYKSNLSFTDANGNGIIEPGETVDITFELSNTGATGATNISALLLVTGTNTQVTQNTSAYPDISSGQTGNSLVSYTFMASGEENLRAIPFELAISTTQGTFTEPFLMPLSRSLLEMGNRSVLVNGVETNLFAPNDVVQVHIDIRNTGQIMAEAVNAELTTTLPVNIASVTNATYVYGDIEPGEELTNASAFTVEIGSSYTGQALIFELGLTDVFGLENVFEIDLSEVLPPLISVFDYTSRNDFITPIWSPVQNMGGYHVYRSDTETGVFERVNNTLIITASMFTDLSVTPLSEYWYKISVASPTGNELPLAALVAYPANTTLGGHGGFPIQTNPGAARAGKTSPIAYDINGDGKKEIFLTQSNEGQFNISAFGRIMGFYESGEELFDIDSNATEIWGFAETLLGLWSSPAIGDIDNDGQAEVFAIGRDNTANAGVLYGFRTVDTNNDNKPDFLWDNTVLPGQINIGHRTLRNPVLADLNGNGYLEIIILDEKQRISVYDRNKNLLGQKQLGNTDWAEGEIAVGDVDGDGFKEIVIGCKEVTTGKGAVYIWDHNGNFSTNLDLVKEFATGQRADTGIVLADIDNDGKLEALLITKNGTNGYVYALNLENGSYVNSNWGGSMVFTLPNGTDEGHIIPRIAVGDLNRDGNLEVVFGSKDKLFALDKNGSVLSGFPVNISDIGGNAPALADIDQDDNIEIIVNSGGIIRAFEYNGSECTGWGLQPDHHGTEFVGTPYVGDINNNGKNEVIVGTSKAVTYVWETLGDADKVEWGSYRANAQNTAVYREECTFSSDDSVEVNAFVNTTWNEDKHIQGDLKVRSNGVLTITSKVTFTKKGKIIVEPGGKLVIDGGVLTAACGGLWEGIKVEGNKNLPQNVTNQGFLEIKNGAVIERARIGVSAGIPPFARISVLEAGGISNSGGIVRINNAVFKDNIYGVSMSEYPYSNSSYILNSTFESSEVMGTSLAAQKVYVHLWKVYGVSINNNTFVSGKKGIVAYDSRVLIMDNHFEGQNSSVQVQGTGSAYLKSTVTIKNNTFDSNLNAVYLNNTNSVKILSNDIAVVPSLPIELSEVYDASGLYIVNSNGFHIENNDISRVFPGGWTTGIFIRDCKASNVIYKNTFSDLSTAIHVSGKNSLQSPIFNPSTEGLQFICNEFNHNNSNTAIYIAPNSSIAPHQGIAQESAGNTFFPNCTGTIREFNNNMTQSVYYFAENSPTYIPNCNNNVSIFNVFDSNECPSTIADFISIEDIHSLDGLISEDSSTLDLLIDGGSTGSLIGFIDSVEDDVLMLRDSLLRLSPNLSEKIMIKLIEEEELLPEVMLKDVLVANPISAKSEKIQKALDNRESQLPSYMREEIDEGLYTISPREIIESGLMSTIHEREKVFDQLITQLKNDEESNHSVLIDSLLSAEASIRITRGYELVDLYVSDGAIENAENLLENLPNNFDFSEADQTNYETFLDLYGVKSTLLSLGKEWPEITSMQENVLTNLAMDTTSVAGMRSRAVLSLINEVDYGLPIPSVVEAEMKNTVYNEAIELFEAFPKTTSDYFIVHYSLPEYELVEDVEIIIFDDKDREVKKLDVSTRANQFLIECKDWKEGIYWVKKITAGYIGSEEKITINRGNLSNNEKQTANNLIIYPVPAKEYFFVVHSIYSQNSYVLISNNSGAMIKHLKLKSELTKIDTGSWSNGVYFISLFENNNLVSTAKIIVAK